jgi:predicted type IV restriction endonuclease/predicted transport protein
VGWGTGFCHRSVGRLRANRRIGGSANGRWRPAVRRAIISGDVSRKGGRMEKLIHQIEWVRSKLDGWRKLALKETPTRTIIIDPLLEALGWDVRDPDEVQLEYPTVDSKSVDYALLINKKPVLLVEAKSLDDPLNDVKAITQVVGYAANDGIMWCILTNGVIWKVYRSMEKCPAPEKLMFEVSLDPRDADGLAVEQIARQMWRFSQEEMAKGTLDALGEQTFNDSKVRKALDVIMLDAPRNLLNLVRDVVQDEQMTPQRIKESLARIWARNIDSPATVASESAAAAADFKRSATGGDRGGTELPEGRRPKATRTSTPYDEAYHTDGKPKEVLELYRAVDRFCLALKPGEIERHCVAMTINYRCQRAIFCCVELQKGGMRVCLKLKYGRLVNPPEFARDVSNIGHYGVGDVQLAISNLTQLETATPLIRMSLEGQMAKNG